ncbi:MAG: TM2 domain-containing protein [Pseudomonadales bacterium]|nr:TM2 domain-containing protein [Pseudomonadales bacterium]
MTRNLALRPKEVWIAYLLCVPFGIFGLHNFYLRKPLWGVLYFFTGGLIIVGWLYDLVTLVDQVDTYNDELYENGGLEIEQEEEIEALEEEILNLREHISDLETQIRQQT